VGFCRVGGGNKGSRKGKARGKGVGGRKRAELTRQWGFCFKMVWGKGEKPHPLSTLYSRITGALRVILPGSLG